MRIVLVEPEHGGNIGSIARLMMNFGLTELWLVNPKAEIGDEARVFASHAQEILDGAKLVETLDEALNGVEYVVGTTSILAKHSSNVKRTSITPKEFADSVWSIRSKVALLFGREGTGLSNEELIRCDIIVSIPSNPAYRTLNVASASAILFYELWNIQRFRKRERKEEADRAHRERMILLFNQICQRINLPSHKERLARTAFKNIISRAFISKREATLLMGIFRHLLHRTALNNDS